MCIRDRNPDDTGEVVQFCARRDQGDLDVRIAATDFKYAGERTEAGTDDGDAGGWVHETTLFIKEFNEA